MGSVFLLCEVKNGKMFFLISVYCFVFNILAKILKEMETRVNISDETSEFHAVFESFS